MARRFEAHQRALAKADLEFQQTREQQARGLTIDALPVRPHPHPQFLRI